MQKFLSQTNDRRVIKLRLDETQLETTKDGGTKLNQSSSEAYQLTVDATEELITITGTGNAGVFYGIQTLLALMDDQGLVPQVSIRDSPRFPYRGLMVDVARNFQSKQEIIKLLDVMAMYKMNKLHFHLSDNEGWRLEIPGIEELTLVRDWSLSIEWERGEVDKNNTFCLIPLRLCSILMIPPHYQLIFLYPPLYSVRDN